jgi:hypothetical protein
MQRKDDIMKNKKEDNEVITKEEERNATDSLNEKCCGKSSPITPPIRLPVGFFSHK